MKMQKAEVKFVTFGAHDVIATSGPSQSMAALIGLIASYNNEHPDNKLCNKEGQLNGIPISSTGADKSARWLKFFGYADDTNMINWADINSVENQPEADIIADSIEAIERWLASQTQQ